MVLTPLQALENIQAYRLFGLLHKVSRVVLDLAATVLHTEADPSRPGRYKLTVVAEILLQVLHKQLVLAPVRRRLACVLQDVQQADRPLQQQVQCLAVVPVLDLVVVEALLLVGLVILLDEMPVELAVQLLVGRVDKELIEAVLGLEVFKAEHVQ